MAESPVLVDLDGAVATVTLNRPAVHNAFDEGMIAELIAVLGRLAADPAARCVVLRGAGKSFCAGADLGWMKRMAGFGEAENLADARGLAELMHLLDTLPKPTVALVHGAAYGGGVGLVACCDIAIADEGARFCLSEVRLGLIPAVIGPYVGGATGARAARRYFQTAEVFDAERARRLGLVHETAPAATLDAAADAVATALLKGAPGAQAAAKALVADVTDRPPAGLRDEMARRIAALRAGAEGREGVAAFLEKRKPGWRPG
ncbi:MAG: enoyl-CoA hydratase/isomerase family protein [Inquilinus sp.]|nr:enoyl-CoA hydratase/isomerase family protein [Inquilinus sp.]